MPQTLTPELTSPRVFTILRELKENPQKNQKSIKVLQNYVNNMLKEAKENYRDIIDFIAEKNTDKDFMPLIGEKSHDKDFIRLIEESGLQIDIDEPKNFANFSKNLIKIDAIGIIKQPDEKLQTLDYLENKSSYQKRNVTPIKDYELRKHPTWSLFRHFPNFQLIEKHLLHQLNSTKIHAKTFEKMNHHDFLDAVFEMSNKEIIKDSKGNRECVANPFVGEKNKLVQFVTRSREKEVVEILKALKNHPKYIESLVDEMKTTGRTVGIVVKDEDGDLIEGTILTVDHKDPRRNARTFSDKIAKINLLSNMQIVPENTHDKIIHGLENGNKTSQYEKINFAENDIVFAGGLSPILQIRYDFKNSAYEQKRLEMIESVDIKRENLLEVPKEKTAPVKRRHSYHNTHGIDIMKNRRSTSYR